MTQPGDEIAADAGALGCQYASHFDRVQVLGTLKAAFVQGRLTEDEYDARVGKASASQTQADLAVLIADIPAGSVTARPPTANDARIGVCVIIAAATVLGLLMWRQPDNGLAFMTALLAVHGDRGHAHNRGPDGRLTASEAVRRAGTAASTPQYRRVIVYVGHWSATVRRLW